MATRILAQRVSGRETGGDPLPGGASTEPDQPRLAAPSAGYKNEQASWIFCSIAETANSIARLGLMLDDIDELTDRAAVHHAVTALARQSGLLADMGVELTGSSAYQYLGSEPEKWLLPPAYHDAAQKADRQ